MLKYRLLCLFLVSFGVGAGAIGQVICPYLCRNLDVDQAWNDNTGNCYTYAKVYGKVMYNPFPTGGPSQIQLENVSRLKYDDCQTVCTKTPNPQEMIKGGEITEQVSVAWYKCVPPGS